MKKILCFAISLMCLVFSGSRAYSTVNKVTNNKVAYVAAVYDYNGKRYVVLDYAEFLSLDDVLKRKEVKAAALKDGSLMKENNKYFIYDDYYIYNPSKNLVTLSLSNSADLKFINYNSSLSLMKIDYNTFKSQFSKNCRIYKVGIKSNIVTSINAIYTP